MYLSYDEARASLTVYDGSRFYVYGDLPLCTYRKAKKLLKAGKTGKAWQLVKKYDLKVKGGIMHESQTCKERQ